MSNEQSTREETKRIRRRDVLLLLLAGVFLGQDPIRRVWRWGDRQFDYDKRLEQASAWLKHLRRKYIELNKEEPPVGWLESPPPSPPIPAISTSTPEAAFVEKPIDALPTATPEPTPATPEPTPTLEQTATSTPTPTPEFTTTPEPPTATPEISFPRELDLPGEVATTSFSEFTPIDMPYYFFDNFPHQPELLKTPLYAALSVALNGIGINYSGMGGIFRNSAGELFLGTATHIVDHYRESGASLMVTAPNLSNSSNTSGLRHFKTDAYSFSYFNTKIRSGSLHWAQANDGLAITKVTGSLKEYLSAVIVQGAIEPLAFFSIDQESLNEPFYLFRPDCGVIKCRCSNYYPDYGIVDIVPDPDDGVTGPFRSALSGSIVCNYLWQPVGVATNGQTDRPKPDTYGVNNPNFLYTSLFRFRDFGNLLSSPGN